MNDTQLHQNISCVTTYSGKIHLHENQRHLLIAFDFVIMLLNLVTNGLVIYVLLVTKQLTNISLRLIFFLCVSDLCLGVISQPLFAVMMNSYADQCYCSFESIVQFFAILFTHTSAYSIAVIGYDRYCRIHHLNRYHEMMQPWKLLILSFSIIILSLCQAVFYVLGTQMEFFDLMKKIAVIIDAFIATSSLIIYLVTLRIMQRRRVATIYVGQDIFQSIDRVITRVSSRILLALILFYLPYVIISALYSNMNGKVSADKQNILTFALFLGFLLAYCNSWANAVIFICANPKARDIFRMRPIKQDTRTRASSKPTANTCPIQST